jgi:hypothetical protein
MEGRMKGLPEITRRNVLAMTSMLGAFGAATVIGLVAKPKAAQATPVCFLRGTRIWTSEGETEVENLKIGDLVVVSSGELKPIRWIGRRVCVREEDHTWDEAVVPVRVMKSALGSNTPHRDLYLSRHHGLYLDGAIIPVVNLINHATIAPARVDDLQQIEYFHIKVDGHDVIYSEGAASETLRTVGAGLDNVAEYKALYGEEAMTEEPFAPILSYWGGRRAEFRGRFRSAISPLIDVRGKLEIIRDRLESRAAAVQV